MINLEKLEQRMSGRNDYTGLLQVNYYKTLGTNIPAEVSIEQIEATRKLYRDETFPILDTPLRSVRLDSKGEIMFAKNNGIGTIRLDEDAEKLPALISEKDLKTFHGLGILTVGGLMFARENIAGLTNVDRDLRRSSRIAPVSVKHAQDILNIILNNKNVPGGIENAMQAVQAVDSYRALMQGSEVNTAVAELAKDPKPETTTAEQPSSNNASIVTFNDYLKDRPGIIFYSLSHEAGKQLVFMDERIETFLAMETAGLIPHYFIYKEPKEEEKKESPK